MLLHTSSPDKASLYSTYLVVTTLSLQVVNGPKYVLSLSGSGYKPRLNLNFHHHDFGPVHVWQQGMDVTKVVLHARNDDKQQCSFDVHCNPNAEHLQVSWRWWHGQG